MEFEDQDSLDDIVGDNGCIPGACSVIHTQHSKQGRRQCTFELWGSRCQKMACHHLCILELVQARNEMLSALAGHTQEIADEDVPMLCPNHVRTYIAEKGVSFEDLMLFRKRDEPDPVDVAVREFSPRTSSRRRPDEGQVLQDELDQAEAGDDSGQMLAKLMATGVATHEDAIEILRAHDLPVQYTMVRDREEFSSEELHFLCYCGALYHKKYRIQKRSKEFWGCAVPALFANKLGKLRASKGTTLGSNKYYDRWTTMYESYKAWRKLLTQSGTNVPATRDELRERIEGTNMSKLSAGLAAVKPYVETMFSAFNEFQSSYTPVGGVSSLQPIALDYSADGTAPTRAINGDTPRVSEAGSIIREQTAMVRYMQDRDKVWLAQRGQMELRLLNLHENTAKAVERPPPVEPALFKEVLESTMRLEGQEAATKWLQSFRASLIPVESQSSQTAAPARTPKRARRASHAGATPRITSPSPRAEIPNIEVEEEDDVEFSAPDREIQNEQLQQSSTVNAGLGDSDQVTRSQGKRTPKRAKTAAQSYAALAGIRTRNVRKAS